MKKEYLKRELKIIYNERKNWNGAKGPFDRTSIRKRELVFIKQCVLEEIAKNFSGDVII